MDNDEEPDRYSAYCAEFPVPTKKQVADDTIGLAHFRPLEFPRVGKPATLTQRIDEFA